MKWSWIAEKKAVFIKLKEVYIFKPVLKIFDTKKLIKIEINLLNLAIKVYLIQKYNDK